MIGFPTTLFSRRRRIALTATLAAAALALSACGGDDSSDSGLIKDGQLVAAMSGEFRPLSFYDGDKLTGFDHDIAVAIAKEMGLEAKPESGAFDTLIQGVKSKRYDVLIASMSPNAEREKAVDFSDPYFSSGAALFVRKDSDCQDPAQLKKASIGVATGTTYAKYLKDKDWVGKVRSFTSDVTALEDLEKGRLDGVVTDLLVGLHQIDQADRDLRPCGEPLYTEQPAFAVDKGNTKLLDRLNKALAAIKADGTYAKISDKYFGQDIS